MKNLLLKLGPICLIALTFFLPLVTRVSGQESGSFLITELVYDARGEDKFEEWVELAYFGQLPLDISGFILGDEESAGGGEGMVRFPDGVTLQPGQIVVVAQTAVAFQSRYGFRPDYELNESDPAVPQLLPDFTLATGSIALANGGDEVILLDRDGLHLDGLSYGESERLLRPPAPAVGWGASLERFPANCDSDTAADWRARNDPDPGEVVIDSACAQVEPAVTDQSIGDVQGSGVSSPFVGAEVTVRGVIIGRQLDRNAAGVTFHTLFVQNTPAQADGIDASSDGLTIFFGRNQPPFELGDELRVTGVITEFFGLTEIGDRGLTVQLLDRDQPLPPPIELAFPLESDRPPEASQREIFESLEGMRVGIDEALVLGPTYRTEAGCGFAVARFDIGLARLIRHEIETDTSFVTPIMQFDEEACDDLPQLKAGDRVAGLEGPLTYNFDLYRIVNQDPIALEITSGPMPPVQPPLAAAAGQFSIATLNVENFFDGMDDTGGDAEPKLSREQIEVKRVKLAHTIGQTLGCPTLVAIQEVEKESLLIDLAAETAKSCGFLYEVSHLESFDQRGIDVALLSDPRRVDIHEVQLRPACANVSTEVVVGNCRNGEYPLFSRPPLQVDLLVDGRELTVLVNHFKSKRGGEIETQPEREAQARFLVELRKEMDGRPLIALGDFNDYADAAPLRIMTDEGGWENVLRRLPADAQYSFNFGGVSQLIDGILVTPELAGRLSAVRIFHVNADFPDAWGEDLTSARIAYKSSDHDPALAIFNWSGDGENLQEEVTPDSTSAFPGPDPKNPAPTATTLPPGGNDVNISLGEWLWPVIIGLGAGLAVFFGLLIRKRGR